MIDFALEKNSDGVFDLVLEKGGFKTVNNLDTAVKLILFTEQRLAEVEQPIDVLRSGWWGNSFVDPQNPDFQVGSKLHLLKQRRNNLETRNMVRDFTNQALSRLVRKGFFKSIQVLLVSISTNGIEVEVEFITLSGESEKKTIAIFSGN